MIPRRRHGKAATEPVLSTAGRWVGGVSIKARDLAAEVAEVIGADGEFEPLVDDGEKVSQGANFTGSLANVKLLKLHGSLNWYVRGDFDKLARVFEAKPTKVVISERPRTNEYHGLVRQIVPPIYGKFFAHKHWRALWSAAHNALVEADALVIIGCSLVDTDFHLSGMLSHAVMERKSSRRSFALVAAVDRIKVRRKWLNLLRGCTSRKLPYRTFIKFADDHLES